MKSLKPSLRKKKRYLLVKGKNSKDNFFKAVKEFIGILGMSEASPNIIKSNDNEMIISVNRNSVDKVRASLAVWPEKMEITKVSGTIKGLGKR